MLPELFNQWLKPTCRKFDGRHVKFARERVVARCRMVSVLITFDRKISKQYVIRETYRLNMARFMKTCVALICRKDTCMVNVVLYCNVHVYVLSSEFSKSFNSTCDTPLQGNTSQYRRSTVLKSP
jgi:hypothetical protein